MNVKMRTVNTSVIKKDAKALVTGKPVFTDDLAPGDCLIVKVLRSPHAHALIRKIDTEKAKKVDGIVCILTYQDGPINGLPWPVRPIRNQARMTG